jgi:putative spermidine/putrescine transport system substrate-binding protein
MRKITRHTILPTAALLAVGFMSAAPASADESLTVASWGGAWTEAFIGAYNIPYEEQNPGVKVNMIDYNGGIAEIRAQVEAGNVTWDIQDIIPIDALRACDEGLLEEIDWSQDEFPDDDFVPNGKFKCGMGLVAWSTVIAYRSDIITGEQPVTIKDFWDLEKFPGKRGLRKVAEVNLEWALIADGVAKKDVYDVLTTPEGVDRAFASLDKIKDNAIWWEAGAQAPQILADGEVTMTTAYNGRIYNAQKNEDQPFKIMWQTQVFDLGYVSVIKGAPNRDRAIDFIKFIGKPEINGRITDFIAYSPVRLSGLQYVKEDVQPHLPTYPANYEHALAFNFTWWADYKDELQERFSAWLIQ